MQQRTENIKIRNNLEVKKKELQKVFAVKEILKEKLTQAYSVQPSPAQINLRKDLQKMEESSDDNQEAIKEKDNIIPSRKKRMKRSISTFGGYSFRGKDSEDPDINLEEGKKSAREERVKLEVIGTIQNPSMRKSGLLLSNSSSIEPSPLHSKGSMSSLPPISAKLSANKIKKIEPSISEWNIPQSNSYREEVASAVMNDLKRYFYYYYY